MVKIGTPLKSVAKKALLCGSGELGKEVAIELQRYGVEEIGRASCRERVLAGV